MGFSKSPLRFPASSGCQATFLHRQYHGVSHRYKSTLHHHLGSSHISICDIATFIAFMHTLTQFFLSGMRSALRASLTCPVWVYLGKKHSALPTDPFQDIQKVTPRGIKTMLCQHPATHHFEVEVFGEDHTNVITKLMSRLKVKLSANRVNAFMQQSNLSLHCPVVGRPFLFVSQFALQPFQLALQVYKKRGR